MREELRGNWDVIAVLLLSGFLDLLILISPENPLRKIIGLPFILFFLGYLLITALFPEREELETLERIALSFGLSIAIVPLVGLLLNYIWEISLIPILSSLTLLTFALGAAAIYRRMNSPDPWIPEISIERIAEAVEWRESTRVERALTVILLLAIIFSIFMLGYIITSPKQGEKFTEFYILGESGKASDYPTELLVGEEGRVIIGVVNHEGRNVTYFIEIWLVNSSYDFERNQTLIHEARLMDVIEVSLPPRPLEIEGNWTPQWERNYSFRIDEPGNWQLWFLLFKDSRPELKDEEDAFRRIQEAVEGKIQSLKLNVKVLPY